MDEITFDIFSGAPEENGLWVEAVEGLSNARQRLGQIAAQSVLNGTSMSPAAG